MTVRIALLIEYHGGGFCGFQAQPGLNTIQGTLEAALEKIANERIFLFCAGRTDAKVHATGQVVHFDTHAKRHIDAWVFGTNTHLPPSIVVRFAKQVDYHFHARFKAIARRYRYIIFNNPIRPGILSQRVAWHYYPLDVKRMQEAAHYLLGEQNFNSFRSSQCHAKSPIRTVKEISIKRVGDFIVLEIEANAFLHHMVRNIAGSLMKIGRGLKDPSWMLSVLEAKSRRAAAETAPAEGLYLCKVFYPEPYIFPQTENLFLLY
jgi:tRNA pseudouridine38-40 synthase